ncbi:MAG: hypothetical protein JNL82_07215 [Myxococcales bacterium]|nr:hypothetical protein [Myxococcales bacterium]
MRRPRPILRHTLTCLALLTAACDRPAAQPEARPDTKPAAQPAAMPDARPAPATDRELLAPIPPPEMVEQMQAQLALDHPLVAPYLHTELPANLPLRLAPSPDLARGAPALKAGGQPVQIVPAAEARLIFKHLEQLEGPRVRVHLEIPPEGVRGHVDLELADHVWRAVDASVVER